MKYFLPLTFMVALSTGCLAQPKAGEAPVAVFYEYPDYQGGRLVLGLGAAMASLDGLRYDNGHPVAGNVLSLQVTGDAPLALYAQPGFAGAAIMVNGNIADIRSVNINGAAVDLRYGFSSLRVGPEPALETGGPLPGRTVDPDQVIIRFYRELFGRQPDERTLRVYRQHMREEHWTGEMVRRDLRRNPEWQGPVVSRMITKAYRDILGREPDRPGLDHYRNEIIDHDMSEEQMRADLRRSAEFRGPVVNRMIAKAYRDVLGREPDASGLNHYRGEIIDHGLSGERLQEDLRRSEEFRGPVVNRIIAKAYHDILGREPDPSGLNHYRSAIIDHGLSEERLRDELRKSAEFKNRPK